jgi:hypothetical protein
MSQRKHTMNLNEQIYFDQTIKLYIFTPSLTVIIILLKLIHRVWKDFR